MFEILPNYRGGGNAKSPPHNKSEETNPLLTCRGVPQEALFSAEFFASRLPRDCNGSTQSHPKNAE